MRREQFTFTISDLGLLLGKSPVTLRQWERKGFVEFPRVGTDRRLTTSEVRVLARYAQSMGRITEARCQLVEAALTLLELIEGEDRSNRPTGGRKD